ncbi:MAG: hypothetical protein AAFZ07_19485 [Actinomycetota bacterium]
MRYETRTTDGVVLDSFDTISAAVASAAGRSARTSQPTLVVREDRTIGLAYSPPATPTPLRIA